MRAIDADELMEHVYRDKLDSRELIAEMIKKAPTIEPERKTGLWMGWFEPGNENYHCSACGTAWYPSDLYLGGNDYPKYCPECGAQMENWRSDTEEGAQNGQIHH